MSEKEKLDVTCFDAHNAYEVACDDKKCRQWIKSGKYNNCTINLANNGKITLEEAGKILGVTRMRVSQIQSIAEKKFGKRISKEWKD